VEKINKFKITEFCCVQELKITKLCILDTCFLGVSRRRLFYNELLIK